MDFVTIETVLRPNGTMEIYPKFHIRRSADLMVRGKDFYAIWDEANSKWSTDRQTVVELIDAELRNKYQELRNTFDGRITVKYLDDGDSKSIDKFNHYVQKQMYDNFHQIDDNIIFANDPYNREQYSSHRLPYSLTEGSITNYDKLVSTLYSPEERHKFEWAIGAIIEGDAKWIQKFFVFVGDHGTGKSTVMMIIRWLFEGYVGVIDAKAVGQANASFALESLRNNPLVVIQDDTDLSKIEDNTRLNSLISHETMLVNEKFKSQYANNFHCMIFLGTNKDVQITDSRSGLIRRLIDIKPSGNKLPPREYFRLIDACKFELGAIAYHCKQVYGGDPYYYDDYVPTDMMRATNSVYFWLEENMQSIMEEDGISLTTAWRSYKNYCDDAGIQYHPNKQQLGNELKGYFKEFVRDGKKSDGSRVYNYYKGFKLSKMGVEEHKEVAPETPDDIPEWLHLDKTESLLDDILADMPAQYASEDDDKRPERKWVNCKTTLKDIETDHLHFVKLPPQHIFIDLDIKGEEGKKDAEKNLRAASQFPPTYAEYSKSGNGIHLHYIYTGDTSMLSNLYSDNIEIKVLNGDASLRRKLSFCNDIPVATLSGGLPLKEAKNTMTNSMIFENEAHLRNRIKNCLMKKHHGHTAPEVKYIYDSLEAAYKQGIEYDVTDLRPYVDEFATNSSNQSSYCMKLVSEMKWASDTTVEDEPYVAYFDEYVFYDVEVFPNLLVIVWKPAGKDHVIWINPTAEQCETLMQFKLIGFNCRKYDNHILYARASGYSLEAIYMLSGKLIKNVKDAYFRAAYNLSYTDIFDYARTKQSLKKWEIQLGIHHQELGLKWNEPVPEDLWNKVAEYCVNDVVATEATFNATQGDFLAREMLAKLTGMSPNTPTNTLSGALIFGKEKHPHEEFRYRNLAEPVVKLDPGTAKFLFEEVGMEGPFDEKSILPYFPGYTFENGKSTYRGKEVGEGGYVYAEPGIHQHVALIDIESMHPSSAVAECLFGCRFTRIFRELLLTRVAIKTRDFDTAKRYFDGRLSEFLDSPELAGTLEKALKIVINSVYGLTSAAFDNLFKDPRNVDNIVAKRGALFMIDLMYEVQERGFTVAHIKTDSIKIPNATPEIIEFCIKFAKKYGYNFVHEATYERMCLVNDAVYVAKYASKEWCMDYYGYLPSKQEPNKWTATGTQFQVPYVFKTLFSHEEIEFDDVCETKSVKTEIYLDYGDEENHDYRFVGRVGQFTPVVTGGATLLRHSDDDKYSAVTGSKGYKWIESEAIRNSSNWRNVVDISYYRTLVDKAFDAIDKYGDANEFIAA